MIDTFEIIMTWIITKGLDNLANPFKKRKITYQIASCLQTADIHGDYVLKLPLKTYIKRLSYATLYFGGNPIDTYSAMCYFLGRELSDSEFEIALRHFNYTAAAYKELSNLIFLSYISHGQQKERQLEAKERQLEAKERQLEARQQYQHQLEIKPHLLRKAEQLFRLAYENKFHIAGLFKEGKYLVDKTIIEDLQTAVYFICKYDPETNDFPKIFIDYSSQQPLFYLESPSIIIYVSGIYLYKKSNDYKNIPKSYPWLP